MPGNRLQLSTKYLGAIAISTGAVLFVITVAITEPANKKPDYLNVLFEGYIALMAATGLFLINDLRESLKKSYWFLFPGLALLTFSMTTDTLDEFVVIPWIYHIVFEGVFQVVGFTLLMLGIAIWVRTNHEQTVQLKKLATTDYLTGILNMRYFVERLEAQIEEVKRQHYDLSLILFDIDHFKSINDTYGHQKGDEILKEIASTVQNNIRKIDVFSRYGGEEFVISAPFTDRDSAQKIAENLKKAFTRISINEHSAITASFGVVQYDGSESIEDFIKRADTAMYQAKTAGRNQVV